MNSRITIGVGLLAIAGAIWGAFYISQQQDCRDFSESIVHVNEHTFNVSVADTGQEKQIGLAGCAQLPEKSGMYFPYDTPQRPTFWMKGMLIPIDILWVADGRIVGIERDVPPPTDFKTELLPTYRPDVEVTGVLELEAGSAEKYGLIPGSPVTVGL